MSITSRARSVKRPNPHTKKNRGPDKGYIRSFPYVSFDSNHTPTNGAFGATKARKANLPREAIAKQRESEG